MCRCGLLPGLSWIQFIHVNKFTNRTYTYVIQRYVYTHTHTYISIRIHMYIYIYINIYIHIYIIYTYTYTYVQIHLYIYMCLYNLYLGPRAWPVDAIFRHISVSFERCHHFLENNRSAKSAVDCWAIQHLGVRMCVGVCVVCVLCGCVYVY